MTGGDATSRTDSFHMHVGSLAVIAALALPRRLCRRLARALRRTADRLDPCGATWPLPPPTLHKRGNP